VEYLNLRVASIDDAITNGAYGISGCAGHTAIYLSHAHQASEKKNVPYLPTRLTRLLAIRKE
jgi:hypothetical protein